MQIRSRTALTGLLLIAVIAVPFGASAAPSPGSPAGTISDVTTKPGEVDLTLTVNGLPAGTTIDSSSVSASADRTTLRSSITANTVFGAAHRSVVREVVLAFDTSGSMAGAGITAARDAATAYAGDLPADVRIGLLTFSNAIKTLVPPTTDRSLLYHALSGLRANGGTSLYDGVAAAIRLAGSIRGTAQRRLLVLSDGADTNSTRTLAQTLTALQRANVPADVVAFRLPGRQSVLAQIATTSGGRVLPAGDTGSLAKAFVAAAQAFGQRVRVRVAVPNALDEHHVNLNVQVHANGQIVTAQTPVTLLAAQGSNQVNASAPTVSLHDKGLLIVLGIAFLGILALALALLLVPVARHERTSWQSRVAEAGRYRIVRSMGRGAEGDQLALKEDEGAVSKRALAVVDRAVRSRGQRERLLSELERAGMRMRPEEWAVLQLATILAVAAVSFVLLRSLVAVVIGGILGWIACRIYIRVKASNRAKAFEAQVPDNLQLLAGSLRSGFSLAQALGTVVREGTEPSASEFTRGLTETRLGADLVDALDRVADRMRCEDLRWVVMAIRISREVGGNLAEVLDNTVETMRERVRLRAQVRVLTAEGRLSARILISLPIFVGTIFVLIRPTYVHPLFHSRTGLIMFSIGVLELFLGAFWLSRLTKIEV